MEHEALHIAFFAHGAHFEHGLSLTTALEIERLPQNVDLSLVLILRIHQVLSWQEKHPVELPEERVLHVSTQDVFLFLEFVVIKLLNNGL